MVTFYIGKKDSLEKETTRGDLGGEKVRAENRDWCDPRMLVVVIVNTDR